MLLYANIIFTAREPRNIYSVRNLTQTLLTMSCRTISIFQLTRKRKDLLPTSSLSFLEPFIGEISPRAWEIWDVVDKNGSGLHRGAIFVPKECYVVFTAELTSDNPPFERDYEIRLWELILDGWVAAGGSPSPCSMSASVELSTSRPVRRSLKSLVRNLPRRWT